LKKEKESQVAHWWWLEELALVEWKVFEREHVFYFGSPPAPTLPVSFPCPLRFISFASASFCF
jgi:hypothetical protein